MKNASQTLFFETTNQEPKKHGWSGTPTIGVNIVKKILTTLKEIGQDSDHRFPLHNCLMGSIAFVQSAPKSLQRVTRGLSKLDLCVQNVRAKTTLAKI
jgi:hypothetical protein